MFIYIHACIHTYSMYSDEISNNGHKSLFSTWMKIKLSFKASIVLFNNV